MISNEAFCYTKNLIFCASYRSEEQAFTRLKVLKIYETELDVVTILNRCHKSLTKFHLGLYSENVIVKNAVITNVIKKHRLF